MTLLDEIRDIMEEVYGDLSKEENDLINFPARFKIERVIYQYDNANRLKGRRGSDFDLSSDELIPIDLSLNTVIDWKNGDHIAVGDAFFRITQKCYSRDDLTGSKLPSDQKIYYLINDEKYTLVDGGLIDEDGITWKLILQRIK